MAISSPFPLFCYLLPRFGCDGSRVYVDATDAFSLSWIGAALHTCGPERRRWRRRAHPGHGPTIEIHPRRSRWIVRGLPSHLRISFVGKNTGGGAGGEVAAHPPPHVPKHRATHIHTHRERERERGCLSIRWRSGWMGNGWGLCWTKPKGKQGGRRSNRKDEYGWIPHHPWSIPPPPTPTRRTGGGGWKRREAARGTPCLYGVGPSHEANGANRWKEPTNPRRKRWERICENRVHRTMPCPEGIGRHQGLPCDFLAHHGRIHDPPRRTSGPFLPSSSPVPRTDPTHIHPCIAEPNSRPSNPPGSVWDIPPSAPLPPKHPT